MSAISERAARGDQDAIAHERDGGLDVLEVARIERDARGPAAVARAVGRTTPISSSRNVS